MRVFIYPYGPSNSALALSRATGWRRLRTQGTTVKPRTSDIIINWGNSKPPTNTPSWGFPTWINHPMLIRTAASKFLSLTKLKEGGINVPEFTQNYEQAKVWLSSGNKVVCRALDNASSGRGITLCSSGDNLPVVPLYTKYVPKYDEYRIHVFNGEVIDVQQKKRRNGGESDSQIRTGTKGWVFCREGVEAQQSSLSEAIRATKCLGLTFGAVDLGYTRQSSTSTVYEVNTAPGLQGSTVENYANKLTSFIRSSTTEYS